MKAAAPPRLLVRTLTVTVVAVGLLLSLIFTVVSLNVRRQVRQNVANTLDSTQRLFAELESLRQRELRSQAAILAENPTLKAAIDTFAAESQAAGAGERAQLVETMVRELDKLASHVQADAIMLLDQGRTVLASTGSLADQWPTGTRASFTVHPAAPRSFEGVIHASGNVYRSVWVDLQLDDTTIGTLYLATLLDDRYATELGRIANAYIAIVSDGRMIASTLPSAAARAFDLAVGAFSRPDGTLDLDRESFVFRRLVTIGGASFYALGSVDALSEASTAAEMRTLALVALGAMLLALLGSIWLAQMITGPIGRLSHSLATIAASGDFETRLPRTGSSREVDALTDTFNELMTSVGAAEAETEAAYTGAIRALAAALDARDPYTAGHSERVSVLSIAIGRTLDLSVEAIEILRLGALLHDIGKIGVSDAVLRKPGPLTDAEYAHIQQHTVLGGRILRSVPFLSQHIPIVELHHERPDGGGYPYGLRGNATPLTARIVHVADAYDAMTSARAYRAARSPREALNELWRGADTAFDPAVVEALVAALRETPEWNQAGSEPALSEAHA